MKRIGSVAAVAVLATTALGGVVGERWAGAGVQATHPGTLKIAHARNGKRLVFNLAAIPKGGKVYHASLFCFTDRGRQPTDPVEIYDTAKVDADGKATFLGKALKIEAPWYRSFDATAAVARWVKDPKANLGLTVARFEHFLAPRTYLEVWYAGQAKSVPPQATGVRAVHRNGQTFVVWTEHPAYRPKDNEVIWVEKFDEQKGDKLASGPGQGAYGMPNHPAITLKTLRGLQGLGVRDKPSGFQGIKPLKRVRQVKPVTYRVYRHTKPITAANIHRAQRIAEVDPLSGYETEVYAIHFQGEYINQREEPASVIPTFCTGKGQHLRPGEGLYVHTAGKAGKAYYAVTTALAGTENLTQVGKDNALAAPVAEAPATPQPVLQWVQHDRYRTDPTEYWYRFWAAPPYCSVPSRPLRVAVAASDKMTGAVPLNIGTISDDFNVRGSLNLPRPGQVTILIQRQLSWLPALFYNEGRGTLRSIKECKVDYFSERYMNLLIKWVMGRYTIDRSKISGGLMYFGMRHPEIFTRMSFGSYTTAYDYRWAPGGPSMPTVLGPRGIKTVDGDDAWEMYSVEGYLKKHPGRDIPFLICISGTGKDGGHTSEFGWQDDPRGWAALNKYRQTYVAAWSCGLPRELSGAFGQMRWDVSIPAFSNCSLDNNPGNGDPADGDFYGCINGWLLWSDTDQADEKDKWEMTVRVIPSCPDDACTVDVTPRHCKKFKPRKGQKFKWTNTPAGAEEPIQSGTVAADEWGLVTLKGVKVTKGKNRLVITRK